MAPPLAADTTGAADFADLVDASVAADASSKAETTAVTDATSYLHLKVRRAQVLSRIILKEPLLPGCKDIDEVGEW